MSLRKLHLHGHLAELVGQKVVELDAATVAEAINGLCKVTGKALHPNAVTGRHLIKVLGFDTDVSLTEKTDVVDLHLVPAFSGGKSGWFTIVLGIIMIAVAVALFVLDPALGGLALSLGLSGAMMLVTGIMAVVSPAPDTSQDYYLGATMNTVKIGTRIPYLVGRFPIGGQILSFNVVTSQYVKNPFTGATTYNIETS